MIIQTGQSWHDVALIVYGDASRAVELASAYGMAVTDKPPVGIVVSNAGLYDDILPATARLEYTCGHDGIGCMQVGVDFEVAADPVATVPNWVQLDGAVLEDYEAQAATPTSVHELRTDLYTGDFHLRLMATGRQDRALRIALVEQLDDNVEHQLPVMQILTDNLHRISTAEGSLEGYHDSSTIFEIVREGSTVTLLKNLLPAYSFQKPEPAHLGVRLVRSDITVMQMLQP